MKTKLILLMFTVALVSAPASHAEETVTLPKPQPGFSGKIGATYKESTPDYPRPLAAPDGAPNVLLILTDDTGFGHAGTFGGAAATPTLDRLAASGLRYNRFHTTALCSPSRAALLTGRNHHSVGTGVIMEMGTGYPGYTGIVPDTAAGLPAVLRMNGYATACIGKWHNTPATEVSPAGPLRPLADRQHVGFRILLRLHGRRDGPVLPGLVPEYFANIGPALARGGLSAQRGPRRSGDRVDQQRQRGQPDQTLVRLLARPWGA
jgi:arylsulfatase A-like enzyme